MNRSAVLTCSFVDICVSFNILTVAPCPCPLPPSRCNLANRPPSERSVVFEFRLPYVLEVFWWATLPCPLSKTYSLPLVFLNHSLLKQYHPTTRGHWTQHCNQSTLSKPLSLALRMAYSEMANLLFLNCLFNIQTA